MAKRHETTNHPLHDIIDNTLPDPLPAITPDQCLTSLPIPTGAPIPATALLSASFAIDKATLLKHADPSFQLQYHKSIILMVAP